MKFSLRNYHLVSIVERSLLLLLSIIISITTKPVLQTFLSRISLFTFQKNVWWNLSWLGDFPWGSFLGYIICTGIVYVFLFFLLGIVQNIARFFLERQISAFDLRKLINRRINPEIFPWHFHYLFLHPHRRIAWIIIPLGKKENIQQFAVEQMEKRLSEIDNRHIESLWTTIKTIAWFSILMAWFLSLWKFYQYVFPIISGSGNLNSIGLYFSSSFRIFVHSVVATAIIICTGLIGRKLWVLYLFHLDEAIFDEIICKIEREKDQTDKILRLIKEAFLKLDMRISNLERAIKNAKERSRHK